MHRLEAKMVVLGAPGVGKTSLTQQFLAGRQQQQPQQFPDGGSGHQQQQQQQPPPTIGATYSVCKLLVDEDEDDDDDDEEEEEEDDEYANGEEEDGAELGGSDEELEADTEVVEESSSRRRRTLVRLQIWDTAGQERFRSVAPMYYRNAQAALLVFDLTSYASFADVRMWLQQLHENVPHPIVLALVGNKLDLGAQRAVSHAEAQRLAAQINGHYFETSAVPPHHSPPSSPSFSQPQQQQPPSPVHSGIGPVMQSIARRLAHRQRLGESQRRRRRGISDGGGGGAAGAAAGAGAGAVASGSWLSPSSPNSVFSANSPHRTAAAGSPICRPQSSGSLESTAAANRRFLRQRSRSRSHGSGGGGGLTAAGSTSDVIRVSEAMDAAQLPATGVGRLETAAWSIDSIAHAHVQPAGCCY